MALSFCAEYKQKQWKKKEFEMLYDGLVNFASKIVSSSINTLFEVVQHMGSLLNLLESGWNE